MRLGICRPAQPFSLLSSTLEATQASEDLFTVEPLPMRPSTPSSVEEAAATQERPSVQRLRNQRHRRRQVVTLARAAQEQSTVAVEGPAVDGEEVTRDHQVACLSLVRTFDMSTSVNTSTSWRMFTLATYACTVRVASQKKQDGNR